MFSSLPAPYSLRRMATADVPAVMAIEQVVKSSPWTAEAYQVEVDNPQYSLPLVLWAGAELVGYMVSWLIIEEVQIATIVTAEAWRGRGLGELLLHHTLQHGLAHRATTATLEVRVSNVVAQNLYRKYGFVEVGRRRKYYRDNGEDALLMTAELAPNQIEELGHSLWQRLATHQQDL
jgi:[ribosomal protein S18]-alanine N-acetyltransferase